MSLQKEHDCFHDCYKKIEKDRLCRESQLSNDVSVKEE
jgi:hypothetical protein